ncbi:MAG: putative RecB family exonuclease [Nocardioidaceae bacterium]|nr:putative RecB family exonuclease [Nocardioidaceae bacterium]
MSNGTVQASEGRTVVDGVDVLGSLSPSRAGDFMSCPLLFRFRTVDHLPEPFSPDAVRGTVVHKVLEDLFDLPAGERTPARAAELIAPAWQQVLEAEPEIAAMFGPDGADPGADPGEGPETPATRPAPVLGSWLESCRESLAGYFALEDPTRLEPAERELYVETLLASKLLLRGFVDRIDVAPSGDIRVVDYKTGKAPGEGFEAKALFQMKFYALVIWRTRGVIPRMLQLIYLGSGELLRYSPDEQDLLATERKVEALWKAIVTAQETGDWRPRKSALCGWCAHRSICPEWGGTPPPLPAPDADSQPEAGADAQPEAAP